MRTVLIVGASSGLGRALFPLLASNKSMRVLGTYCTNRFSGGIRFDLVRDDPDAKLNFIDDETTVVVFAAVSDPQTVFGNPMGAREVNVDGLLRLLDFARQRDARVIFSSSVEALDGISSPQIETVKPRPLNLYGQMKLQIEAEIEKNFSPGRFAVVRTPWISHLDLDSRCVVSKTYFEMQKTPTPNYAVDYLSGIISGNDAVKAYRALLGLGMLPKIIHFAADGHFSRAELADLIRSFSQNSKAMRFEETTFSALNLPEERASDTRLDNSYSKDLLGLTFETAREVIRQKVDFLDRSFQIRGS